MGTLQKNNLVKYCRECGVELTDENWAKARKKVGHYICKKCLNKNVKEYHRQTIISSTNGKFYRVNKRFRPNKCEICNKEKNRLDYHHWDNDFPALGLWLCTRCHRSAEGFVHGFSIEKYLELKIKITKQFMLDKNIQ